MKLVNMIHCVYATFCKIFRSRIFFAGNNIILRLTAFTHATYCLIPKRNFDGSLVSFIDPDFPEATEYSFMNSSNIATVFLSKEALAKITCFNFGSLASIHLKKKN